MALGRRSSYIPGNPSPNKIKLFKGKAMKTKTHTYKRKAMRIQVILKQLYTCSLTEEKGIKRTFQAIKIKGS